MELDTVQKIVGIIGGIVAIFGTLFSMWRDWPKVQERLQKRASNQSQNKWSPNMPVDDLIAIYTKFMNTSTILFALGGAVFFIGGILSSFLDSFFIAHFTIKLILILAAGASFVAGIGFFMLVIFERRITESKGSALLWGLLFTALGFGLIYLLQLS